MDSPNSLNFGQRIQITATWFVSYEAVMYTPSLRLVFFTVLDYCLLVMTYPTFIQLHQDRVIQIATILLQKQKHYTPH